MKTMKPFPIVLSGLLCTAVIALAADKPPTAFQLVKEGNHYVTEQCKDKVMAFHSEKSVGTITPNIWYVDYYDPDAKSRIAEVKFAGNMKLEVNHSKKPFGGSGSEDRIMDFKKVKVDSDRALDIAVSQELLKPLTLKASQMWLEPGKDGLLWKVCIWAAKINKPEATVNVGEIFISPEDGKVIRTDLHVERVD